LLKSSLDIIKTGFRLGLDDLVKKAFSSREYFGCLEILAK
jgi:hypothetical protein